ncbi:MAG: hypothetical protein JXR96_04290 [Deltaproteobacteria bacterium]|nr:hypothetical protein [Deltaproteobacteria bacterium]
MIFVECYADTALVHFLGHESETIKHLGGKGRVVGNAWKYEGTVGLVDQDPGSNQPRRMKEFSTKEKMGSLQLKVHPSRKSVLVVVPPRLEEWFLRAAKEAKVDIREFGLSDNAKDLHAELGSSTGRHLEKLEGFLEALQEKKSRLLADMRQALAPR